MRFSINSPRSRRFERTLASFVAIPALALAAACGGSDAPTAPVTPPPVTPTTGILLLRIDQASCGSNTWSAEIFVDGLSIGRKAVGPFVTDATVTVPAGNRTVSFRLEFGTQVLVLRPQSITVVPGTQNTVLLVCN